MEERTAVYSKQYGEPGVPVTVRIEWRPDGRVKPCMFWMTDGSCYVVRDVCEMTHLALLKDRGEGVRFKVRAESSETPETYDGVDADAYTRGSNQYKRLELYLYLADNMFCGKDIVDARYGHMGKEYIHVTLDVFPNCEYELAYFIVQGARYKVEKLIKKEPRGSYHAGGAGIWHKVEARLVNADDDENPDPAKSVRRMAALYFEVNKWFVVVGQHA